MNNLLLFLPSTATVLWTSLVLAAAADIKPIRYEASTNYARYQRSKLLPGEPGGLLRTSTEVTNVPATIKHSITFGSAGKPLFILKASEALPELELDGWTNMEMTRYFSVAWIESPTNESAATPATNSPARLVEGWNPKAGDRVVSSYGGSEFTTTVDRVEYVGIRSATGILVYGVGLPGIDSFWVRPAPPENNIVILDGTGVTNDLPPFILSESLVTNEVAIGSATIGGDSFNLVALRQITNRVVRYRSPQGGDPEFWTNSYPGPYVATNFVRSNPTNITINSLTNGLLLTPHWVSPYPSPYSLPR